MSFPGQRIRVAVDVFDRSYRFIDVLTGEPPSAWRGGKGQFEVAFFNGHDPATMELVDFKVLNGISSITLALRGPYDGSAMGRLSSMEFSKSVLKAALNTISKDDWNSNAADKAHAIITFSDGELSLDNLGDDTKFWMTLSGLSEDDPAQEVPLAASVLTLMEDGVQDGNAPRQRLVIRRVDDNKKFVLQSRWENNQAANEMFATTEVTDGVNYPTVIVKNSTDNTWHEVVCTVNGETNSIYADPTPIAGVTQEVKRYVRNITDLNYYQLLLETDGVLELSLSNQPL